jgi:hypothetical protein
MIEVAPNSADVPNPQSSPTTSSEVSSSPEPPTKKRKISEKQQQASLRSKQMLEEQFGERSPITFQQ